MNIDKIIRTVERYVIKWNLYFFIGKNYIKTHIEF